MTTILLFTSTLALLPLIGAPAAMIEPFRQLHRFARLGIAAAASAVAVTILFVVTGGFKASSAFSFVISALLLAGFVIVLRELRNRKRTPDRDDDVHSAPLPQKRRGVLAAAVASALALATLWWATVTAQITSTDLLLFWGTKAARFLAAGGVDFELLRNPDLRFLHADYPPLVPLLLAAAGSFSGFSWFGALSLAPLFTTFALLAFFGFARTKLSAELAAALTSPLAALLTATTALSLSAGNAEPVLLFFEVLALSGAAFCRGRTRALTITLALAGAVLTKVEGTAFAALALVAFTITRQISLRRAITIAAAPVALATSWIAIVMSSGAGGESYRGTLYGEFTTRHFGSVVRTLLEEASFDLWYLPWVLAAIPLVVARRYLRAALPYLLLATGYLAFIVYCYLHGQTDPAQWMRWSAMRLLMTLLVIVYFAGVAASIASENVQAGDDRVPGPA